MPEATGIVWWAVAVALTLFGFALLAFVRRRRHPLNRFRADRDSERGGHVHSESDVERLVGASFEAEGYAVEYASGAGPVSGVDLVLRKGQERTLVQCQQWRARSVGVASVREFYGAMEATGATRGIVFTGGEFTTDAHDFANGRKLELRNGRALRTLLRSAGG